MIACRGWPGADRSRYVPVPNGDGLGLRRGALVGDLGLKPGADLHVVAATVGPHSGREGSTP